MNIPALVALPPKTHIGHAHLQVPDLKRALDFYAGLLGFREAARAGGTVFLSANGKLPPRIVLTERPGARPKPPHTTGLYHVAIRYPNRVELARAYRRLAFAKYKMGGMSDHGVSEALYLSDPHGNGLELYADRPKDQWRWNDGQVEMVTEPLNLENLLAEADGSAQGPAGNGFSIHPATDIGHIHLHVSGLARGEVFYHGILGLDVTQRDYPGALFLSAGKYHHHVGVNIWAGAGALAPPPEAVGLVAFSLVIPDEAAWAAAVTRAKDAGVPAAEQNAAGYAECVRLRDLDSNAVDVLLPAAP